jgi:putative DNA primase/helicase
MTEAQGIYEIRAHGRDSLHFVDPHKAGEVFFAVKRDEFPKVIRHESLNMGGIKESVAVQVAMTVRASGGNGHEHLLLDAPPEFRAGYEAARQRQPEKAVPVQDMQQQQSILPQHLDKGQSVSEQQHPSPAQDRKPAIDRSGPLDIPPGRMSAEESLRNATVPKVGEELAKALASAQSVGYFKRPGEGERYPVRLVGTTPEKTPSGREYYSYQGMGVANTREELEQAIGKERAQQVIDAPGTRGHWKNQPEQVRQAAQEQAAPPAHATPAVAPQAAAWDVVNSIEPLTERVQQQAPAKAAEPAKQPWSFKASMQRLAGRFAGEQQAGNQHKASVPPQQTAKEAKQRELMNSLYERFDVRGNDFVFKGEAGRVAFTDLGKQITSRNEAPEAVRGIVDLVQAKGWEGIKIDGSPEFKRAVWLEANLRQIDVKGHEPTAEDRKMLAQALEQRALEKQQGQEKAPEQAQAKANAVEQAEPAQGRTQQQPAEQKAAQTQQQAAQPQQDDKRQQAMNAMRSYLGTQNLDQATVAETLKDWGAHLDKAIAQGKAVPTVRVYDPSVQHKATPQQAVAPQVSQERAAPVR